MKYLGIDYGTRRIGLAISDDSEAFAFPYKIIDSNDAVSEIAKVCDEETIEQIVIGESIATNEAENDMGPLARHFAEKLKVKIAVPIFFEREDFSTVEAHRYQTAAGNRDDSAAAIILQRFLDKKRKQV